MQAKRRKPKMGNVQQFRRLSLLCGYLFLSPSLFLQNLVSRIGFLFLYLTWAAFLSYDNVCFTYPTLCACIVNDVCVCIYIYACLLMDGCALCMMDSYGLESNTLVIMGWACIQGDCCRCIFIIYCVHDHHSVCLDPCQLVTLVFLCMRHTSTCSMLWRALARLSMNILTGTVYIGTKPYQCAIVHQM